MFKIIGLFKRRPGMTITEFREYYESRHRLLGEKYLRGYASRYVRRYLSAFPDPASGTTTEPEYDVALEIWYPDQQTFAAASARLREPHAAAEIIADEEQLFDRRSMHVYFLEERESEMPAPV